jgi:hypothetical protein
MDKFNFLNDLSKKLLNALPESAQTLKQDIEKNFRVVLQNAFGKLDLVTREEFDAQTKVLARSRQKIEALEKKISALEKMMREKK